MQHIRTIIPDALAGLVGKWTARRDEWQRLGAQLEGSKLAGEVLADLDALARGAADDTLTLQEASAACGYNPDSLSRLIRQGKLTNVGTKHRPRVRAADLPMRAGRKAGGSRIALVTDANAPSVAAIAREAVASRSDRQKGA